MADKSCYFMWLCDSVLDGGVVCMSVCRNMCVCKGDTEVGVNAVWNEPRFSQVGEQRTRVPEDKVGFFPSSAPVAVVLVWGPGHRGVNSGFTSVTKRHLPLWPWLLHRSKEYHSAPVFVRHKYLWQFPWHFRARAKRKMVLTHLWCLEESQGRRIDISQDNVTHQHL